MAEIFKSVPGFEGVYAFSNYARMIRVAPGPKTYVGKEIKCQKRSTGYFMFSLWKDGEKITFTRSRLLAQLFIPNPKNLPEVNHIDGDKTNDTLENLEWVSMSGNRQHAYSTGLNPRKFTAAQIKEIRSLHDNLSMVEIGKKFEAQPCHIWQIIHKKLYRDIS